MLNIKVLDNKKNELIKVKIDLNKNMYIVVPEIVNHRFDYMRPRLMDVRSMYLNMFLENNDMYKNYEQAIYNEMKNVLLTEVKNIYENEGIMYYVE